MSYLVLDIETVPDVAVWSPPAPEPPKLKEENKPGKADLAFLDTVMKRTLTELHPADLTKAKDIATRGDKPEAAAQLAVVLSSIAPEKPPFPPLWAHRPIAIGFLLMQDDLTVRALGCAGASTYGDDERRLLEEWSNFLGAERPTLVSWNGRGFDMPVLNLRSFRWGVSQGWYGKNYRYRYDEDHHLDLCDVMSEFGFVGKHAFSLNDVARLIGLPGKFGGMDGSQVERVYKEGGIKKIEAYCQTDVLQTAFVFERFLLMRGRVDLAHYRVAAKHLLDSCRAPFAEFCGLIDEKRLLLE